MGLVTLQQAKDRVRVRSDDEDDDILAMIEQASRAVVNRVDDADTTDAWDEDDEDTIPDDVKGGVLEMVAWLYERDVTANQRADTNGRLPPRVELMIRRYTSPSLA